MRLSPIALLTLLTPVFLGLTSSRKAAGESASDRPANVQVTIAWQGSTRGCVDLTCGCWPVCVGGVAYRAAFVESLRVCEPRLLLVDVGSFFSSNDTANRALNLLMAREMERLRYDAVALGNNEIQQWELIRPLLADSRLPIVCTNVEYEDAGVWRPIGQRSRLVDLDGVRVGIMSAVADDSERVRGVERLLVANSFPDYRFRPPHGTVRYLPAGEACREEAGKLRGQVDLLLLLAPLEPEEVDVIAQEVPAVDVILATSERGGRSSEAQEPGHTAIYSHTGGSHMVLTHVIVSPAGQVLESGSERCLLGPTPRADADLVGLAHRIAREANAAHAARPVR